MNKNTPTRSMSANNSGMSPVILHKSPAAQSPQRNLTGPPRIIKDIIADLYNNIQSWNSLHIRGCTLVKQIASLKAAQNTYSEQLEEYINDLHTVVSSLNRNIDIFDTLEAQVRAFARLPNVFDPVFFSLSASAMSDLILEICQAYIKEFQTKRFVLENIAHTKTESDAMFLAAYWTHHLSIGEEILFKLESLLVESGHRPIQ